MISSKAEHLDALKSIVKRLDYRFWVKIMRGISDCIDPWYDYAAMERSVEQSNMPYKAAFRLLHMGVAAPVERLAAELGQDDIQAMIQAGIWYARDDAVSANNLVLLPHQGLLVLTEINPWYETCSKANTDVYIGADSLRLAEHIAFCKGAAVLDLCSGTGIQGLLAARSAKKVVSVELNPKATPVTRFNILLNGLEGVIDLREGDLYGVLSPDERFDYIYANPPFIPMVGEVAYPVCGSGGEDGLMVLNRIFDSLGAWLKPSGEAVVFCECLGDANEVFFFEKVQTLARANGWRVNALCAGRSEAAYQIARVSELTRLFNKEDKAFDAAALAEKLAAVYYRLGASYLYSVVFKITSCGEGAFCRIDSYNPWDAHDRAETSGKLAVEANKASLALLKDGRQIGALNNEAADILEQLLLGKTAQEAASALWGKHGSRKKYQKYGYPAFLSAVLATCRRTEGIGAIKRQSSDR